MKCVVALVSCILIPVLLTGAPPPRSVVPTLIEQLGSTEYSEREKATRCLLELEKVPQELRRALDSSDPEVRRRAAAIIDEIEHRPAGEGLAQATRLAEKGEFDQAIERLLRWAETDPDGRSLQSLSDLAARLVQAEKRQCGKTLLHTSDDSLPTGDLRAYARSSQPTVLTARASLICKSHPPSLLRGAGVRVENRGGGLIAATGEVIVTGNLTHGVIFAGGSITLGGRSTHTILVCDSDVRVQGDATCDTLIIARGDVTLPARVWRAAIVAGGTVKQAGEHPLLLESVIRPQDASGLGLIKFFDPAKAGIEVIADRGGVKVQTVHREKPFAAGLRPGDVVTAINGTATHSPAVFRKVLRSALAEWHPTIPFTVRRAGETIQIRIRIQE